MILPALVVEGEERIEQAAHRGGRKRETQITEGDHRRERGQREREQEVGIEEHGDIGNHQAQHPDQSEMQKVDDREIVELLELRPVRRGDANAQMLVSPVAARSALRCRLHQGEDQERVKIVVERRADVGPIEPEPEEHQEDSKQNRAAVPRHPYLAARRRLRLAGSSRSRDRCGERGQRERRGAVAPASGSGDGRGFNDGVAGAISNMLVVTLAATAAPEADTILGAG